LVLPFAVSLGLAQAWSKYLKHHREAVPAWFEAMSTADGNQAFAAFVATGGAGDGSGGAAAGGAAGGGSSGAS
jgi:hypothetical protein